MKPPLPKVKQLARELGTTPRKILDWCRAQGLDVQNSVSRVDPESERRIRRHFADPKNQ